VPGGGEVPADRHQRPHERKSTVPEGDLEVGRSWSSGAVSVQIDGPSPPPFGGAPRRHRLHVTGGQGVQIG